MSPDQVSAPMAAAAVGSMIELRDVCLQAGERTLIEHLSVDVAAGQRWVVVGPNGAGKSTLLAALAGLTVAGEGIRLEGLAIASRLP